MLRELACNLGESLGLCYPHAHRDVGVQGYFPHHSAHKFHGVAVPVIAVKVEELFVYGVAFGVSHGLAHYAFDPFGYRLIEHQVARKYGHSVLFDYAPHPEERVSALEPQRLCFGSKRHYVSVIA